MESLGEQLAEHAAHLDAAMHRFLADLRRFDDGQGWALQAAQTCAHWLAWRLGMDRGTAREHLRVAHRLGELSLVDDALRRGALSYSKVRAITRVAVPATEAVLIGMAERMTANQLETTCRKLRMTQRQPADPSESAEHRFLSRRDRDDGMTQITVVLRPDEAARLFCVLDAIAAEHTTGTTPEDVSAETRSPSDPPTRKIRELRFDRCDALMEMAERQARGRQPERAAIDLVITVSAAALSDPALDRVGAADGVPLPVPASARGGDAALDRVGAADGVPLPVSAALGGDRAPHERLGALADRMRLLPSAAALIDCVGTAAGTCLPLSTIRRLACDTGVVIVAEDEHGTPLSVGRKHRMVTGSQKRALARRDPHCQFPGCTNSRFLEAHHIKHWLDGGTTDLISLLNLCSHHHNLLHEHRFIIEAGKPPRFFDELGRPIEHVPARPQPMNLGWAAIRAANANLEIREDTNMCRWDGADADYEAAIAELCRLEDLACELPRKRSQDLPIATTSDRITPCAWDRSTTRHTAGSFLSNLEESSRLRGPRAFRRPSSGAEDVELGLGVAHQLLGDRIGAGAAAEVRHRRDDRVGADQRVEQDVADDREQ